ncbi:MAG TPA: aminodeoxychorismate synthase component I [Gemmataceae bacterium]|nr:aminodeoxychorismate synthase component I [Gemmataceae bacterium]
MIEQWTGLPLAEPGSASCDLVTPVAEELTPWLDPWDVCQRLAHLPHLLFLDSAFAHPMLGRYSFVAADPFDWLWARGRQVVDNLNGSGEGDPFAVLARKLANWRIETIAGLPPFQGGAAGLFGYDLCHHIEHLPRPRYDEFATPDMAVGFYDWVIAFDHAQRRAWLLSTGLPETDPARRRRRAVERLQAVRKMIVYGSPLTISPSQTSPAVKPALHHALAHLPGMFSNFDRAGYLAAARRAIEYIHAGDCFQVNLSQRLLHAATLAPLELYGRLRERNPAPFAGYFDLGDFVLASASPERFLRVESGHVETRPIKGTRPRGVTPEEDARQRDDLLRSAKDHAENVMIIDLLRNDLGRVCSYGSVRVPAVCRLESYRTVHHLVSEVVGQLRPGLGLVDLLRAAFPGGSVTGAPKVRAMEIIAELEQTARGPYCGSLGYLGFDGSMDTNILIRTFTIGRGWMQFPVGGGIVADSTPESEYEETLHKAEGLLRALRGTNKPFPGNGDK